MQVSGHPARSGERFLPARKSRSWPAAFWRVKIIAAILEPLFRKKILTHSGSRGQGPRSELRREGRLSEIGLSPPERHADLPGPAAHAHSQDLPSPRGTDACGLVSVGLTQGG